jgi:hypothetical protein
VVYSERGAQVRRNLMDAIPRRQALKTIGAAGTGALLGLGQRTSTTEAQADDTAIRVAGRPVEIVLEQVSPRTIRVSVVPIEAGRPMPIPLDGSLVRPSWNKPFARISTLSAPERLRAGDLTVIVSPDPITVRVETADGRLVQELQINRATGSMTFPLGDAPVVGFGQGGPQFDRRGSTDRMRSGQGAYRLRTHGGRVPVPWLIGTGGWALFIHQPFGHFDLTGPDGSFTPATQGAPVQSTTPAPSDTAAQATASPAGSPAPTPAIPPTPLVSPSAVLPLDVFLVASRQPTEVMAEWARLTGFPELPPLWTLGYQQSHRTLASREEVVGVANTFREKRLPCDALIYLGTGFTPSGWNAQNGSFAFNRNVFSDPKAIIDELHALNFRVVLHAVILARTLHGTVHDRCDLARYDEEEAGCYWQTHRKTFAVGADGWWPDEGDPLNIASRLARNRMYWEGPQIDRPNERPYALHRNGYAGMHRYAAFLWSGDVFTTWETLRTHVPVAINTGLTGIPYWGTDIGGFVPTKEFTGELYVRWFQLGAFCPLFRAHGRTWKLRLPWGWNTGDLGPNELTATYGGDAANPDPSELHNPEVEPICRQYLNLRYRLLPYLYSVVYEGHRTGLPIMRALWLHYPDDPSAVARGDEYLWGRDLLVAPVTERGAKARRLYLPRGRWYDFWTNEAIDGGREIDRPVDLATTPLYVRAGGIVPMGPVKQYTDEQVSGPLTLTVYPGADGQFLVYEDDGRSFAHRTGAWMGIDLTWEDATRRLTVRLAKGSRLLPPARRPLEVRIAGTDTRREVAFEGREVILSL